MTNVKERPNGSKSPSFFRSVVSKLKPPVAPVSSGTQHDTPRRREIADPTRISVLSDEPERRTSLEPDAIRCEFIFSDGRQCRNQRAQLCSQHALKAKAGRRARSSALEVPELEALCGDLTTATNINRALAQTFLLMAQGRISRKDAVAFGYLSQLLLQTVSGVRAEYVAAFGSHQWENKLKTSLMPNADDDPELSPGGDSGPSGGRSKNLEHPRNGVVEPKEAERPLAERIMGEPDYADILSRSLNLLDRKYDFTPEGRCEAKKLALELELMKPAPAKPAKDFFGQTVDLMRRFRDAERQDSSVSIPPALDYYGHPIAPPLWADKQDALPPLPPPSRETAPPTEPDQHACSSAPVAAAVPQAQRSCGPSASDPADFVAPPSRRPHKPRSHSSAPGCAPHSELPLPVPTSATAAKRDSLGGPDEEHHEGHRTDWYAPPSWSNIRKPDPYPSREEKLRRKIRGLTNSAFRRLQHQNSRGFWNKGLQKLIP
jgi:hypothetical protein